MNKTKMKSKSAISFKEYQHIANEVVEIGNDWGFYVDIETNHKLIDFHYNKKTIFNKKLTSLNTINENENENENFEEKYRNQDYFKNINKKQKRYNYFCNFIKIYLIKYTCPIITTFILSYYIFTN